MPSAGSKLGKRAFERRCAPLWVQLAVRLSGFFLCALAVLLLFFRDPLGTLLFLALGLGIYHLSSRVCAGILLVYSLFNFAIPAALLDAGTYLSIRGLTVFANDCRWPLLLAGLFAMAGTLAMERSYRAYLREDGADTA